ARYLRQGRGLRPVTAPRPARLLFTAASPRERAPLDWAAERDQVGRAADGRGYDAVRPEFREGVSQRLLGQVIRHAELRDEGFHVWHHCGHGGLRGGEFVLALEGPRGEEAVSAGELAGLVADCPSLRAVFLNVCHGGAAQGLAT